MGKGNLGTSSQPIKLYSERVVLTPRTSDPSSPAKGEHWYREDLDSGTDKRGEVRWYDGSSKQSVPVFNTGTSSSGVEEVVRIQTKNGLAFVPIAATGDAAFPERRLQHNGNTLAWHNSQSVIPDSAVAHYVASDINANDGDTITTWPDSLGSLDLTGGNPTYQTNVLAGEPAVRFDGVDDVLNVSFSSAEAQPNTIFIVGVNRAPNSDNQVFFDGTSDRQLIYWVDAQGLRWALFAGNTNVGGSQDSSANLLTAIFDGASSVLREDGTQTDSGDPGGGSLDGITLGAYADQSEYGEVDILEVVPCNNRLTPAEIDNQEQRLANRYGITI